MAQAIVLRIRGIENMARNLGVPSSWMVCVVIFAWTVGGCGDSSSSTGGGGTGGGGGSGPECTTTAQCLSSEVCEPVTETCVTPIASCTSHAECNDGTYCEQTQNVCLQSSVGAPCAGPDNCNGECIDGFCGCSGVGHERQLGSSPLDIYLVLDRTASMLDRANGSRGSDCDYLAGISPPDTSKACYATYALADYLINVSPAVDTSLAFNVMSLSNACNGDDYVDPLIPPTPLPVTEDSALVQRISDENFNGGYGTRIEGALRGIAKYTASNQTPGREMIGVLITDGDATNCDTNNARLAGIIADHLADTGIRTFIIGMEGASESKLEQLAVAGGAEEHQDFCGGLTPPCHYWNVGDASGDVLANALQAISEQAIPLPCEIDVRGLKAPEGEALDYSRVNVTLTEGDVVTTIPQVGSVDACPSGQLAWYYDEPSAPTSIFLCQDACDTVTAAGDGAKLNVVAGCQDTVIIVQ